MKKINKLILQILLGGLLTLWAASLISPNTQAAWAGPTSLNTYVQPEVEMRAVWVATVGNLNMPTQKGTSATAIKDWKDYYISILDTAEKHNLNTIVFQIRPENDAFYPSKYNPWSKYLVSYGANPGWDPLEWMLQVTHERGMEYHAWLNPYRASNGQLEYDITKKDPSTNISKIYDVDVAKLNEYKDSYFGDLKKLVTNIDNPIYATGAQLHHNVVLGTEDKFILNPASPIVRTHIDNTIKEIVDNYDIDGIHFDDYFYPDDSGYAGDTIEYKGYTYSCEPWVDMADYKAYVAEGGTLNIYDWRRNNVDMLIEGLSKVIKECNKDKANQCAFGISPCARWAPTISACSSEPYRGAEGGMSGGCNNYYAYSDLYANTLKWALEEWVDYIVPQNYTNLDGDYGEITLWWQNALKGSKTLLFIGTGLYLVSSTWGNSGALEILYQLRFNQTKNYNVNGYFLFSYDSMIEGMKMNAMNTVSKAAWKQDALTPLYNKHTYKKLLTNNATVTSIEMNSYTEAVVKYNEVDNAKAYAIYEVTNNETIDLSTKKIVGLSLKGHNEITFKYNNTKKYVLVTYDQDNTIYSQYDILDFNQAHYKAEPQINEISDIYSEIKYGEGINLEFTVSDEDSETLDYQIYLLEGTIENSPRETLITKGSTVNGKVSYQYIAPIFDIPKACFKINITDGAYDIYAYTTYFTVLSDYTNKIPVGTATTTNSSYHVQETVSVKVNISDDSETFKITGWYIDELHNINELVLNTIETSNKENTYNVTLPNQKTSTGYFKFEIYDGNRSSICKTPNIKVISKAPVINSITGLANEVKINQPFNITTSIIDDSSELTYKIYYAKDGATYELMEEGTVESLQIIYSFFPTEVSDNATFKIEVSDGESASTKISSTFKIVEEAPAGELAPIKKGCSCKKSLITINFITSFSLLIILLRKREH